MSRPWPADHLGKKLREATDRVLLLETNLRRVLEAGKAMTECPGLHHFACTRRAIAFVKAASDAEGVLGK